MKVAKLGIGVLAVTLLIGCGGNGFEGTYSVSIGGAGAEMLGAMGKAMNQQMSEKTINIGSDYIEADGKRQSFKKIFERDANDKRYLVFQTENGQEEVMTIVDDKTLLQDQGFVKTTLHKK